MNARRGGTPRIARRESRAGRSERAGRIAERLGEAYPDAECALEHDSPWELLVATILSAQCTDEMVNRVTPGLFEEFPDPRSLAAAPGDRVESLIKRTGFFRQKTKSIQGAARAVVENHGGKVPADMNALTALPGVGRKTASVLLGTAFRQPAVFVDTHVGRLSRRLGLTKAEDPEKVESDLKALLPSRAWTRFCHRLIHHGRRICSARSPKCEDCPLADLCPMIGVSRK